MSHSPIKKIKVERRILTLVERAKMVQHTANGGQMEPQSHQGRSFWRSGNSALPSDDSLTPPGPLGSQACRPQIEHWSELLQEFDVKFLMLNKHYDAELLGLLQAHPSWAIDSQDEQSVLLVRTDVRPSAA